MPAYKVSACAHNGRDPARSIPEEIIEAHSAIDAASQLAAQNPQPPGWTLTVSVHATHPTHYEFGSYDFRNVAESVPDLDN